MRFADAVQFLDGIPYTSPQKGSFFYQTVIENGVKDVLELGFAHGCSTCYFAAAVMKNGGGHIDAVDIEPSAGFKPSLEELGKKTGLGHLIDVHRETSSYTWWLKKKIEAQTRDGNCQPCYDLIFIDGPKDWTNDGAAFFMADKLLRPGGLMLFDDFAWSYESHRKASGKTLKGYVFPQMSDDEFNTPHVRAIFHLLVAQHPGYSDFQVIDDMIGQARKVPSTQRELRMVTKVSPAYVAKRIVQKVLRRMGRAA